MDRAGGTLGYEGIEILRSVETKKVKWYKGSVIPSTAEFKRTAKKVEQLAHVLAPFVLGTTAAGDKECIDFQPYWKIVGTIFRAFGLLGVGKLKSLLCVFSLDGAKITKNLGHTMAGMKLVDRSMRCPFTNNNIRRNSSIRPLFLTVSREMPTYLFPKSLDAIPHSLLVAIGKMARIDSVAGTKRMAALNDWRPSVVVGKEEQVRYPLIPFVRSSIDVRRIKNPSNRRHTLRADPL
jgi:hypothetical protein